MLIHKKSFDSIPRESAHAGSGARRMYADIGAISNPDWRAMTYGYLPSGAVFDWHEHIDIDEMMLVIHGDGVVHDREWIYTYKTWDFFIFPANTEHRIENPTNEEHEFIFIRIAIKRG